MDPQKPTSRQQRRKPSEAKPKSKPRNEKPRERKPAKAAPKSSPRKRAPKRQGPKNKLKFGTIENNSVELKCTFRTVNRNPIASRFTGAGLARVQAAARTDPKVEFQLARLRAMAQASHEASGGGRITFGEGASAQGSGLSDCAALYAKAIANPFGSFSDLPCVPCSPPVESQRVRSLARGTFVTGTNTYGYICAAPYVAAYDLTKVVVTDSTFAGTSVTKFNQGAAGEVNVADVTLPYTAAQQAAGISSRLVGLGLRWRNLSPAGTVGGEIFAGQVDDATNLTNSVNFSQWMAMPQAQTVGTGNEALKIGETQNDWSTLVYRPQDMESLDFSPDNGTPSNTRMTMAVLCKAPVGSPQTFEWELVEFFEYTGYSLIGGIVFAPTDLQTSHADSIGLDRVLEAAQRVPLGLTAQEWVEQTAVGIIDSMAHSDSAARTVEDLTGGKGLNAGTVGNLISSLIGFLAL